MQGGMGTDFQGEAKNHSKCREGGGSDGIWHKSSYYHSARTKLRMADVNNTIN